MQQMPVFDLTRLTVDNNVMHAKPDLRVFLKWMIAGSGSVITDVIRLNPKLSDTNMDTFQFLIPTENLDAALLLLSKELNHSEFTAKTGLTFADSVITYGGTEYAFPTLISDNSKQKAVNWGGDEAGSRASIDSCLWVGSGNVISALSLIHI